MRKASPVCAIDPPGPTSCAARRRRRPSVKGDILNKRGRFEEARAAFEATAALADNRREHDLLGRRAAEAADAAMSSRSGACPDMVDDRACIDRFRDFCHFHLCKV